MNIQKIVLIFLACTTSSIAQEVDYALDRSQHISTICGISSVQVRCTSGQQLIQVKACSVHGGDFPLGRYTCSPELERGSIHTVGTPYGSGMDSWESAIAVPGVPAGKSVSNGSIVFPPQTCLNRIGYADVRAPRGSGTSLIVQSKAHGDMEAKGIYPVDLYICVNFAGQ